MKTQIIFLVLALQTLLFASVGKITAVNGDVSVVRATKTIKATSGFTLEEKDGIKSSKGSSAQIVFNDKTVITVGSDTLFKVEEYSSDAASPKARFGVNEGTFKAVTGKIGKIAPDKFKIETKTATIGIRGTTLFGRVHPDGRVDVACTRGAITVSPNIPNPPPPVIVKQNEITQAGSSGVEQPRKLTPNDMQNLQGGLAPFAKNNTPNNNNGDDNGGGTPNQQPSNPQQQTNNTPLPNLDNVKDLTAKAVDNLVNDTVLQSVTNPWAAAYGSDYVPGVKYVIDGWKTRFSSLNGVVGDSVDPGSDVEFNFNLASKTVTFSGGLLDSPTHSGFTIASEDSFSFVASGSIYDQIAYKYVPATAAVSTADDPAGADYVSWGYWEVSYTNGNSDSASEFGTWVGGALTKTDEINALVASDATVNYKGQSIGGVVNSNGYYSAIKVDANNIVNLSINFGSNKAITGNIAFNTVGGQNWNVAVDASTSAMTMQFSAANSYFRASTDGGNPFSGTGSNGSAIATGTLDGNFYGPNAKTIGGSFRFVTGDSAIASGVFKANKQ